MRSSKESGVRVNKRIKIVCLNNQSLRRTQNILKEDGYLNTRNLFRRMFFLYSLKKLI